MLVCNHITSFMSNKGQTRKLYCHLIYLFQGASYVLYICMHDWACDELHAWEWKLKQIHSKRSWWFAIHVLYWNKCLCWVLFVASRQKQNENVSGSPACAHAIINIFLRSYACTLAVPYFFANLLLHVHPCSSLGLRAHLDSAIVMATLKFKILGTSLPVLEASPPRHLEKKILWS